MKQRVLFIAFAVLAAGPLAAQSGLFVVTSDFSTGSTAFVAPGADAAAVNLLGVHGDAVGHYQDGRIYVINRLGQDNILVLDAADPGAVLTQFSVGNGANPHDIEVIAPDKAYVSLNNTSGLLIVDPRTGATLGTVDMEAFADADGLPEMSHITRIGDRVYVSCLRLDRDNGWGPAGDSFLAVIDVNTDQLVDMDETADGVQGIVLAAPNPSGVVAVGQRLVVASLAGFGDRAGGIGLVDAASGRHMGLAVGEEALQGDVTVLAMVNQRRGYAVVSDENFVNHVRPFDLVDGTVGPPLVGLSGGFIQSIAVDGDRLIVGDRGSFSDPTAAGLKFFDAASGALLAGPVDTGLPPASIVVLSDAPVPTAIAQDEVLPRQAAMGKGYPNPFNATVTLPFEVKAPMPTRLEVFDVLGRRVRTLVAGQRAAGWHLAVWDGRDEAGRVVGNGAYLVRLRLGEGAGVYGAVSKVMLAK